jgi:hypothetical protein
MGSVIVLSAEDDPADTQIPRLLAAGANCKKVHIISAVKDKDGRGIQLRWPRSCKGWQAAISFASNSMNMGTISR